MTEKTDKTYINSICDRCYWCSQCGEDNMQYCKDLDQLDMSDEAREEDDDLYIERIEKVKRRSYNREWHSLMKYMHSDDWSIGYDI